MTDLYIANLKALLIQNADQDNAHKMKKYMKNHFEFLGIRSPELKALTKQFIQEYGLPEKEIFKQTIDELWRLPEREFQYAALTLLNKKKKELSKEDIPFLEKLVTMKSWWDTIDSISPNLFGSVFNENPELIKKYTKKWVSSDNIWLQRSAILFQLKYKEKTDTAVLFDCITALADSKEFFVRKAIGWALREYSKTDAETVIQFVKAHNLSPLSEREALKVLKRKGLEV